MIRQSFMTQSINIPITKLIKSSFIDSLNYESPRHDTINLILLMTHVSPVYLSVLILYHVELYHLFSTLTVPIFYTLSNNPDIN